MQKFVKLCMRGTTHQEQKSFYLALKMTHFARTIALLKILTISSSNFHGKKHYNFGQESSYEKARFVVFIYKKKKINLNCY